MPSEDGTEVYRFDLQGRHLQTLNSLTGAPLMTFGYDQSGLLVSITDADENVTSIDRSDPARPQIVGPYGHRAQLAVGQGGYLESVSDAAGASWQMDYQAGGLLSRFEDPRQNALTFGYDVTGRLAWDVNPEGGGTCQAVLEITTLFVPYFLLRFVDPCDGGESWRDRWAASESIRVEGECLVEGVLPLVTERDGGAVVD